MTQQTPSLSFSAALNASTSKIFQFEGRSRRSEFWWTQFVVYVTSIALTPIVGGLLDLLTIPLTFRRLHDTGRSGWWWGAGAILKVAFFVLMCSDLVMTILNSETLNGFGSLFIFAFFLKYGLLSIGIGIYQVLLFIFCCLDSEPFENKYGPSPKYVDEADETSITE